LQRPVPVGTRLAYLPVPRPATAARAATEPLGGHGRGDLLRQVRDPAAPGRGPVRQPVPGAMMSEQTSACLEVARDGAVATITLNRPAALNALDTALKRDLLAALAGLATDQAVRAVVLAGAGRAFCVGQDLREHART